MTRLPAGVRRLYAGMYFGRVLAAVDGRPRDVVVRVAHNPEWDGPDKWSIEIDISPYGATLVEKSDAPCRTFGEAKAQLAILIRAGFTR